MVARSRSPKRETGASRLRHTLTRAMVRDTIRDDGKEQCVTLVHGYNKTKIYHRTLLFVVCQNSFLKRATCG